MAGPVKLYGFMSRDRSARIAWLLNELGVDWQRVWLDGAASEHKAAAYRAINPFGKVPAIEIDGRTIYESGAIIMYLTARHPDAGLAPAPHDEAYWDYLQWLFWGLSTIEMAGFDVFRLADRPDDPDHRAAVIERLHDQLGAVERHLTDRDYVLGERFSAADIAIGYPLGLLTRHVTFDQYPATDRYIMGLLARNAAREFVEGLAEK